MSCSVYDRERLIERASVSVVHGGSALRAAKTDEQFDAQICVRAALELIFTALCSCAHGSSKFDSETKLIALHALVKIVLRRYYLLRSGDRK